MERKENTVKPREVIDDIVGEFRVIVGWSVEYQKYFIGTEDSRGSSYSSVVGIDIGSMDEHEITDILLTHLSSIKRAAQEKIDERAAKGAES